MIEKAGSAVIEYDFVVTLPVLLSIGGILFTWWATRNKGTEARFARVEARVDKLERDVQRLADHVERLPNAEMMHRLELTLARMEGNIDKLDERLRPVAAIAARMQDVLIEQGRK